MIKKLQKRGTPYRRMKDMPKAYAHFGMPLFAVIFRDLISINGKLPSMEGLPEMETEIACPE